MSESISAFQAFPQLLGTWLTEHAQAVWWYTALVRFLFPILALLVLVRAIRGLLRVPHTPEQWGQLSLPGGGSLPCLLYTSRLPHAQRRSGHLWHLRHRRGSGADHPQMCIRDRSRTSRVLV